MSDATTGFGESFIDGLKRDSKQTHHVEIDEKETGMQELFSRVQ